MATTCSRCGVQLLTTTSSGLCGACSEQDAPVSAPAPVNLRAVRYFGDYEILEEIGEGGMGEVFRVRHLEHGSEHALKAIRIELLRNEELVERFIDEVRALKRLRHPYIVRIYEADEFGGRHYFTMELVEGGKLADERLRETCRNDPKWAAATLAKVAKAVDYMHREGIFHRDLKPENILIDSQEEPRVTDLGVAKLIGQASGLTRSGFQPGTLAYKAPEQITGKQGISIQADVWSLGVILYELLGGKLPFEAETDFEIQEKIKSRSPIPLRKLNSKIDRNLEFICLTCLRKEAQHRYGTAGELAEDLERWGRGELPRGRPVSLPVQILFWARCNPYKAATLALGGLIPLFAAFTASYYIAAHKYLASEHGPVYPEGSTISINTNGRVWTLPIYRPRMGKRFTDNLWSAPFQSYSGVRAQAELLNMEGVPSTLLAKLKWRLRADMPGLPDWWGASEIVTNGQTFTVPRLPRLARNFYFEPVGWDPESLLRVAPKAQMRFRLWDAELPQSGRP